MAEPSTPTTLIDAAFVGDLKRVQEFIAAEADVNEAAFGTTPLLAALQEPPEFFDRTSTSIVELLLEAGADPNGREPTTGRTALHEAVRPGVGPVRLLLAGGADPNARSDDGSTPLHECAVYSAVEVAHELLTAGADPSVADGLGQTPGDLARREATAHPEDEDARALADLFGTLPAP